MKELKYKVLLLEDDSVDRKSLIRLFEKEQLPYECEEAESVSEAKELLASRKFDVVIADYYLGDGTAFDILKIIDDIPVIIVTGSGDEQVAIKAWKAGAYDYLIKDLQQNYLRTVPITIENAIKYKKNAEQLQLLSAAVRSTSDSVFITDMQGKIVFVNEAFCETYGYAKDEVINQSRDILFEDSRGGEASAVSYHKRKDGTGFPVSVAESVIKNEKGNDIAVVGAARDISERLNIEDRIRAINLRLKTGIRSGNQVN